MARDTINIKYVIQDIRLAIRGNHKRHIYLLSLPYRTVFERNVMLLGVDGNLDAIAGVEMVEHHVGDVNLYGFDTVYNPDRPIGLVAKNDKNEPTVLFSPQLDPSVCSVWRKVINGVDDIISVQGSYSMFSDMVTIKVTLSNRNTLRLIITREMFEDAREVSIKGLLVRRE